MFYMVNKQKHTDTHTDTYTYTYTHTHKHTDTHTDTHTNTNKQTNKQTGTAHDSSPCFAVIDGKYVSARWPGDAYFFARKLIEMLYQHHEQQNPQSQ